MDSLLISCCFSSIMFLLLYVYNCTHIVHYYNYYANSWNCSSFPKPRMSTEYGFQALPSVYSWATVADPSNDDDWSFNGALLSNRQHHPLGNFEMELQVNSRLGLPKSNLSTGKEKRTGLEDMIYLTQVKIEIIYLTEKKLENTDLNYFLPA